MEEEDVECLPDAVVDENVDIHLVPKHFTTDGWILVQEVFKQKTSHNAWICHSCYHNLHSEQSIVCDMPASLQAAALGRRRQPNRRYEGCQSLFLKCSTKTVSGTAKDRFYGRKTTAVYISNTLI